LRLGRSAERGDRACSPPAATLPKKKQDLDPDVRKKKEKEKPKQKEEEN